MQKGGAHEVGRSLIAPRASFDEVEFKTASDIQQPQPLVTEVSAVFMR